ncbi:MAG: D-alanyl-D-alanine dipeptidase [Pelagibacteraceae bacterium]|nr:D-alanyl-D-alanine dipeptidase [Pelagibacteraceae bacterium]|tara:strand:- start:8066 stop:8617 length:552 start_codon:yes stop_codon:yes gene_type:complete
MDLIKITKKKYPIEIDLLYATKKNFTGKQIYKKKDCYLHKEALPLFKKSIAIAQKLDYKIKIFDAFRPTEAQWKLWEHTPDDNFIAHPKKGSPHSRGVAIDLTLVNKNNKELDMGTGFDSFSKKSFHGNTSINKKAQKNRLILLGIMSAAGWDFYKKEWWHYQLFNSKKYKLIKNNMLKKPIM